MDEVTETSTKKGVSFGSVEYNEITPNKKVKYKYGKRNLLSDTEEDNSSSSEEYNPDTDRTFNDSINVFKQATEGLTPEQFKLVTCRNKKIRNSEEAEASTSRKGKTIDLGNWGNVNIPENELELETQKAEFEKYKAWKQAIEEIPNEELVMEN